MWHTAEVSVASGMVFMSRRIEWLLLLASIILLVGAPSSSRIHLPDTFNSPVNKSVNYNSQFVDQDSRRRIPLSRSYSSACAGNRALHSFDAIPPEWNHYQVCSKWDKFQEIGLFRSDDFIMNPPRHLSKAVDGSWKEEAPASAIVIPQEFCVFETAGWFAANGLLFDCNQQYPLIVKNRPDFSNKMILKGSELVSKGVVSNISGPLYSVVIPYNGAFSHTFSTGVSMLVYILHFMGKESNKDSRILVPPDGPFQKLLEAINMPRKRIVLAKTKHHLHHSAQARLVFRSPPFNIICAHWPAGAVIDLRDRVVQWLVAAGHVDASPSKPQNLVVYLWRPSQQVRTVAQQQQLVDQIRRAVQPRGFQLVVEGATQQQQIKYGSSASAMHWIRTAELFTRAAAVIGPHGGAFGNIFLCPANTTVVEFNIPWTADSADGDSEGKVNTVRDMFYSLARGIGISSYWNVWPLPPTHPTYSTQASQLASSIHKSSNSSSISSSGHDASFYTRKGPMKIDPEEVIEILRRVGIAA